MLSLINSPKVKADLDSYLSKINSIDSDSYRQECLGLYKKLESAIKNIDVAHVELTRSKTLPGMTQDTKSDIVEIRKQLDRKLKDQRRANIK